jgi:hypothetical protein
MRIRSIRPEFWASEDVAEMDWYTRLVYIGLWSYVDDNGVGRDKEQLIVAALFPLDDDLREASRRVTGALQHLSDRGQITRYGHICTSQLGASTNASKRRHRAATPLRPAKTPKSRNPPRLLPEPSRNTRPPEKGRRGEGEKGRRLLWSTPLTTSPPTNRGQRKPGRSQRDHSPPTSIHRRSTSI